MINYYSQRVVNNKMNICFEMQYCNWSSQLLPQKETLAITANWTGWIRFCIDNAHLRADNGLLK